MTSPWLDSKTPVGPPASARPTLRQLVYAAVVTGAWSSLLCLVVYLIGRLFGMTFAVAARSGATPEPLPWLFVLLLPLLSALAFALLCSLIRGWRHAGRIAYWGGTLVAVLSVLPLLTQPDSVGWGTRIVLALMHLITWILVVPQIARIVHDSEPGQFVERDE